MENNDLYSFGNNGSGQTGTGDENKNKYIPKKINLDSLKKNEKIINFYTSPISKYSFILTNFNVYGFGNNITNTLGIGCDDVDNRHFYPKKIKSLKCLCIKDIYCGAHHTFVLESFFYLFIFYFLFFPVFKKSTFY